MGADNLCDVISRGQKNVGPETPTVFIPCEFETGPSSGTTRKTCGAEIYNMVMVAVGDVKN